MVKPSRIGFTSGKGEIERRASIHFPFGPSAPAVPIYDTTYVGESDEGASSVCQSGKKDSFASGRKEWNGKRCGSLYNLRNSRHQCALISQQGLLERKACGKSGRDALLFAKANALLNGIPQTHVTKLDWTDGGVDHPYDMIIGSEVVYERESYPVLVEFLRKALTPEGIIILAKNAQLHTPAFFAELTRYFEYKETVQSIRSNEDVQHISLYAIRRKLHPKRSKDTKPGAETT
jgi:hypothetical protein